MDKKGLGMPLPYDSHQDVIDFLYGNLRLKLKKKERPFLKQNRTADGIKGKGEVVPDISLFSKMIFDEKKKCWRYCDIIFNVEVVRNHGSEHSIESIDKIFHRCSTLREAFLYNYESQIWIRYYRQENGEIKSEKSDFSEVFKLHLDKLAKVGQTIEDVLKIC